MTDWTEGRFYQRIRPLKARDFEARSAENLECGSHAAALVAQIVTRPTKSGSMAAALQMRRGAAQ